MSTGRQPQTGGRSIAAPLIRGRRAVGDAIPFGGSRRTATCASAISTGDITARANPSERATSLSAPATRSSFELPMAMPHSRGDTRATGKTGRKASNAACSATKARTYRPSLSDRLTQSLISSGLVCGITPSSIRKASNQPIRGLAFVMPAGAAAPQPQSADYSSSNDSPALTDTKGDRPMGDR